MMKATGRMWIATYQTDVDDVGGDDRYRVFPRVTSSRWLLSLSSPVTKAAKPLDSGPTWG